MQTVGFVISGKENERRRALLPQDLAHIRNCKRLIFEEGYGSVLGISDGEYAARGAIVSGRDEVYRAAIICNPKAPEPNEAGLYREGQTFFGWAHAVQGRRMTDFLVKRRMTAIAWEDMYEHGRHVFSRNNELAGEAAVLHAMSFIGRVPAECSCALIGRGNCARGAFRMLARLGARVTVYDRKTEGLLRQEIDAYDVVVNAVLWDIFRSDHLVYREDLERMKPGSMIIDISCDESMGVETSRSTTVAEPVYTVGHVIHYVVDHTPTLFHRTASEAISEQVCRFVDDLVEGSPNQVLESATIIRNGLILDDRIIRFQGRGPQP
jgi:N5-(carboxyethyl)ornithine synthase